MANAAFGFEKVQGSTFTNTLVDDAILYFDGDTQSIHFGSRQTDPIPSMFSVTRSNGELGTRFHLPIDVESDATFYESVRAGSILPLSNEEFDLGSFEARWRDLYLSGNTIYLGDTRLHTELDTQNLRISDNSNELRSITAAAVQIGDPQIDAETGKTIKSVIRLDETGRLQIQRLSRDSESSSFTVDSNMTTNFNVDGGVTTEKTLSVGGDATFRSNVSIDGDIGVGTNNPIEKLHVEGNIYTSSNLEVVGNTQVGGNLAMSNLLSVGDDATFDSNVLVMGNIGIGIDAPTEKLHVVGTVKAETFIGDGSQLTGVSTSADIKGPASAIDNAVARFDGTTGKLIDTSLVTMDDSGVIRAPSVGSLIPSYFPDLISFPSASTYHGAIAHAHNPGYMYYAHGGEWKQLANQSILDVFKVNDAATTFSVANNSSSAYTFSPQYAGDNNPRLNIVSGATIAFNFERLSPEHPFHIRNASGLDYNEGLLHVANDGTVSLGQDAQGKVSGILFWRVPAAIRGTYRYQCSSHAAMVGDIEVFRTMDNVIQSTNRNVGIGTDSPIEKLHVEGNIYTSSNLEVGGDTQIDGNLTVSGQSVTLDTDVNMNGQLSLSNGALDITSIDETPSLSVMQNGAGDVAHFSQNETRILSIVNNGNVGIGTDIPTEKLHVAGNILAEFNVDILGNMSMIGKVNVNDTDIKIHLPVEMDSSAVIHGDARIQGDLKVDGTMTTINTNVEVTDKFSIVNDGTDVAFSVNQIGPHQIAKFMDDGVPVVSIMDGGLVGMGTNTPEARLHVVGKIYTTSNLEVGGNAQVDGNIVTSSKLTVNDDATFKNNVLIQKDTGIGTSTPSEKLHVVGNIYTTGSIKVDGNTQVDGNLATSSELTVGDDATFDSNVLVTGNIGINTDSPGEKLHVVGNAFITGNIEATNAQLGGNLMVNGDTVTLNSDLQITGQFTLPEGSVSIANTGSGPALMVKQSVDEPVVQLFNGDNNIVTVSSNVGIGTDTPLEKLHVAGKILGTGDMNVKGSVVVDQNLTVEGFIFTNGGITITSGSDPEDNTIQQPVNDVTIDGNLLVNGDVRVTTGTSVRLEQDVFMTGNLGLGTDNPQDRLHVVGDALISGNVRATDAQVTGNLTVDGDSVTLNAGVDINGEFSLSNGSLSIYNSGTVPALSVNQEGTEDIAHFEQNGGSVLRIIDGGNVGIGTSTPTERLQVIGSILVSQEFIAQSDRRVKDNIKLIENGLDKVEQMNGYTFTKMEVEENVNVPKKRMGVIAQELLEIIPEVVHYDKDADRYSVAYGNIVGVLIEGIKDLSKEVKSLSKRVERVERVESLEGL